MRNPMQGSDFSQNLSRFEADEQNPYEPEFGSMPQAQGDAGDQEMKTGTTTVGLTTTGGVVLATDKRASLGHMVSSKNAQKVEAVHPRGALTISGSVSAAQSLLRTLRVESNLYETRRGEEMSMQALSTLTSNLLRSGGFLITVPILGGVDDEGAHVYSYDALGGATEEKYAVGGSGSQFALGVLEQDYSEGIDMGEGRQIAVDCLKSATERDTASGNGMWLAQITDEGVDISDYEDYDDAL